jgi:hypothetical protein
VNSRLSELQKSGTVTKVAEGYVPASAGEHYLELVAALVASIRRNGF